MDSNSNYSQFIEHSFRRLTLLIHQQDVLDSSTSANKTTEHSFNISSSLKTKKNNELELFSLKNESRRQLNGDNPNGSIKTEVKSEPISRTRRTYMRPPKNRTTTLCRSSSSQYSDRLETSFNYSLNSSCSPSVTQNESNELPVHMPYERTLYDVKFERDHQNDVRQKYNIPPPFQREWLRQPRYIPQERPNVGQIQQSKNQ